LRDGESDESKGPAEGWEGRLESLRRAAMSALLLLAFSLFPTFPSIASVDQPSLSLPSTSTSAPSFLISSAPPAATEPQSDVIDEAWELLRKYYLDRTYNGLDWQGVKDRYRGISSKYRVAWKDRGQLVNDMVKELDDPYTRWIDQKKYLEIQKFDILGVGAPLTKTEGKNGDVIFYSAPVPNSAAEKAGIQKNDVVIAINDVPLKGRSPFDILKILDDAEGDKLVLKVQPAQGDPQQPPIVLELPRVRNDLSNPVIAALRTVKDPDTKQDKKIGYLKLQQFDAVAKERMKEALVQMEKEGADAYVLDLRSNQGGNFQSAVSMSSLFMADKTICWLADGEGEVLEFKSERGKVITRDPLVLWTDELTASASEVLTGALRDNCRAVTMGRKTYGKGLVQAVYGLQDGSGLVMTIARYIRPSGEDLNGRGITPDIQATYPAGIWSLGGLAPPDFQDVSKVDFSQAISFAEKADNGMCPTADTQDVKTYLKEHPFKSSKRLQQQQQQQEDGSKAPAKGQQIAVAIK